MSVKPICVIIADLEAINSHGDKESLYADLSRIFSERLSDYHVFTLAQQDHSEPHDILEFKVFYEKDHLPIPYEELKQLILDSIKPQDIQP